MRPLYAARKQAVLDALQTLLPDDLDVVPSEAGLHLTGLFTPRLAARLTDVEASARTRAARNFIQPLSQCFIGEPDRQGLVIGFGRLPVEEALPRLTTVASLLHA